MIAPAAFTAPACASLSGRADDQTQTQPALASVSVSAFEASSATAGLDKVHVALPALDLDVSLITAELRVSLARCRVDPVFCSAFFARVLAHNHPLAFCAAIAFCFRGDEGCNKLKLVSSLAFAFGFCELGHFAQAFIVDANKTDNDKTHTINKQARYLRNIVEKRTVAVFLVVGEQARESHQTPSSAVAEFVNINDGDVDNGPMKPIQFRYAFATVGSVVAHRTPEPVLVLAAVEEKDTFPTVRSIPSEDASAQPIIVVDAANTSPSSFGTATTSSSGSTESSTDDELATGTAAAAASSLEAVSEVDEDEDPFGYAAYETAEEDTGSKDDDAEDAFEFADLETAEEEEVVEVTPEVVPAPAVLVEEETEEASEVFVVVEEPLKSIVVSAEEEVVHYAPTLATEVAVVKQEVAAVQIKKARKSRHHKAYYCPNVPRKGTKPRSDHPSQPFAVEYTSPNVTIVARALDGPILILTDYDHDYAILREESAIEDKASRYALTIAASTEKVTLWLSSVVVEGAEKKAEEEEPVAILIPRMDIDEDAEETSAPNANLAAWKWAAGEEERKEEKKFVRRATSFLQRQKERVKGALLLHKRSETLP